MKKKLIGALALVSLISCPLTMAIAADHGMNMNHGTDQDHNAPIAMQGMQMNATDIMLKNDIKDGVTATAHLRDIHEAMAKNGMSQTHHIMVQFTMEKTGDQIDTGVSAVRVIDSSGVRNTPIKMVAMEGSFGADITLKPKEHYTFEVGTKLKDNKKRLFQFQYDTMGE